MNPANPHAAPPHDRIQALIAAALDGPLDPIDQADVSRHLPECARCRTVASGYAADAAHLREVGAVDPPSWVTSVVIEAASRVPPARRRSWALARSGLLGTLIGLAVVVALLVVLGQGLR